MERLDRGPRTARLLVRCGAAVALGVFAPAAASWAAVQVIGQHNLKFSQLKVAVRRGDTVTFSNNDDVTHNISVRGSAGDDTEDLGLQKPGVQVSHRFDQAGVYSVVCSIHPRMRLTVDVN
jgi:cytochrome c peroxidase